jgi:hypothetical protein
LHAVIVAAVAAASIAGNTRFHSPARFDGAGYAVLGLALERGVGYREIDHPDRPRHDHYPPGYPLALAALWHLTGPSVLAAHIFSTACTVLACLGAWVWFRTLYSRGKALALGVALAINWTWARAGGSIQSEPLFFLESQLAVLLALWVARRGGLGRGALLGFVLGACIVTRHAGVALALAIGLDLLMRKRHHSALAAAITAALTITPWVAWVASVQRNAQIALFTGHSWAERLPLNALFYMRRIPDALTGPLVEVATVFGRSRAIAIVANVWAAVASALVLGGLVSSLRTPRRRLAGLIALCMLALLLAWPFTEAGRFLVPLVPFLLVGGVEGVGRLAFVAGLRHARRWAIGLLVLIAVPYSAYSVATDRAGARERTHAGFDAACDWLDRDATEPGTVATRQPGEVFLRTGREAVPPPAGDPASMVLAFARDRVAYLLVDQERYAGAPSNPLNELVSERPEWVERVWSYRTPGRSASYTIYALRPMRPVNAPGLRK